VKPYFQTPAPAKNKNKKPKKTARSRPELYCFSVFLCVSYLEIGDGIVELGISSHLH
jgi:hypothetical protein